MLAETTDYHCSLSRAAVLTELWWACGISILSAALLLSTHRTMTSGMVVGQSPWKRMSLGVQDKASTNALLHHPAPSMLHDSAACKQLCSDLAHFASCAFHSVSGSVYLYISKSE